MSDLVRGNGDGERERIAALARQVEQQLEQLGKEVREKLTEYAPRLLLVRDHRLWEVLGYDSMEQFLVSPHIDIKPSYAKALMGTYQALVVERDVPKEALVGLDFRRLQYALPAIRAGEVNWQEAVSDAQVLTRDDMARRYSPKGGGPRGRLNAAEEPPLVSCPMCGSTVKEDRLPGEERDRGEDREAA